MVTASTDAASSAPNGQPARVVFTASPRLVLWGGLIVALALSAASLLFQLFRQVAGVEGGAAGFLVTLTYVDREQSIPTWFQSGLLLLTAIAVWTVADLVRDRGQRWHIHWRILAAAMLYLSLDEQMSLHERTIGPVREALGLSGVFFLAWIVVAVPLLVVFVLALLPFLRSLPRRTLLTFVVSGALYVLGSVGVEMLGGVLIEDGALETTTYYVVVGIEELLEMVGMTLFLASVCDHRVRHLSRPGTVEASQTSPATTAEEAGQHVPAPVDPAAPTKQLPTYRHEMGISSPTGQHRS